MRPELGRCATHLWYSGIVHSRPFYVADATNPTGVRRCRTACCMPSMPATTPATGGRERWAYVPSMLLPKMEEPDCESGPYMTYFVDSQINIAKDRWRFKADPGRARCQWQGSVCAGHHRTAPVWRRPRRPWPPRSSGRSRRPGELCRSDAADSYANLGYPTATSRSPGQCRRHGDGYRDHRQRLQQYGGDCLPTCSSSMPTPAH